MPGNSLGRHRRHGCGVELGWFLEHGDTIELDVEKIGFEEQGRAPGRVSFKALIKIQQKLQGNAMARRLIDISVRCKTRARRSAGSHPTIQYIDHQQKACRACSVLRRVEAQDLPDGGLGRSSSAALTHNGTHLDAPWHFHPTMNRGERSWTIDEVRWNGACSRA